MNTELKLGVIGLSEGNGHPYSWSAIFNGYEPVYMEDCGFPVIPRYLEKQKYPDDCIQNAKVTHIWTQDKNRSEHVAKASKIPYIVENVTDMIGEVDAVLLARDDSETHYELAKPFIEAGLPIYIDKPLSTTIKEARKIYALEKYEGQIFTCSALGYASGLKVDADLGIIKYIDACVIKDWNKYAVHIIEPVLKLFDYTSAIVDTTVNTFNNCKTVCVNFENGVTTNFKTLHDCQCDLKITVYGTNGSQELTFDDTFNTFKNALSEFIQIINKEKNNTSKEVTLKMIDILERGNNV